MIRKLIKLQRNIKIGMKTTEKYSKIGEKPYNSKESRYKSNGNLNKTNEWIKC